MLAGSRNETNVTSMTGPENYMLPPHPMMRARMHHGARHPRSANPRGYRAPPPGFVRGPPRVPSGLPPPWAHGGAPMRPGMGPRQFRPFPPSMGNSPGTRSPAGSPIISPRGSGFPYGPRRGGPPPPGFAGHRGPPRHRMPRGGNMYSQHQGPPHQYVRYPASAPTNGSAAQYYSAPPSPILKQQQEMDCAKSEHGTNPEHLSNLDSDNDPNNKFDSDTSTNIHMMANKIRAQINSDCQSDMNTVAQSGSSNSRFSNIKLFEGRSEKLQTDCDTSITGQKENDNNKDMPHGSDILTSSEFDQGTKNMPNEDSSYCSKGDSDLQKPTYKQAKPFETGQSKFKQTWRRLSSVRKGTKPTKRNKAEQRTGSGDRRGTIGHQTDPHNIAPGCDKTSFDNNTISSQSLAQGGNSESLMGCGISPSHLPGNTGLGVNYDGNPNSCGNHMRPSSTTSKESETDGVMTSGYFR